MAVGDSDFVSNSMYQAQGNEDLFLNSVNFLTDRGEFITERPKDQESVYLTMTSQQGRLVFFVSMILIPLFIIIVGVYITIRRRVKL
jgi:ABC-2 type transport system permease protein